MHILQFFRAYLHAYFAFFSSYNFRALVVTKYFPSSTLNYGLVSQMVKETIRSFEKLKKDDNFQKV
jgi:dolichol kinase